MVKTKEYSQDERVAIKYLREAGHSYAEIARQVGCSKSTAHYIHKSLERTGSAKEGARTGRPEKISERERGLFAEHQGNYDIQLCGS